jgi:hypothetical protein
MGRNTWLAVIAAFVIFGALITVISWAGWGPAAGTSHIYGIALMAIGAGLFFLSRDKTRRSRRVDSLDEPFVSYPGGQVFAAFRTAEAAAAAATDLRTAGLREVSIYRNVKGAAALDSSGTAHGLAEITERSLEQLLTDEDHLQRYDTAVRAGGVVLSVHAEGHDADRAAAILINSGGFEVFRFGGLAVEKMDVDRSRTTSTG